MSAKIIIVGASGAVPSEAEGMAFVLAFLDKNDAEGGEIDGSYVVCPHRLNPVSYNPNTGELTQTGCASIDDNDAETDVPKMSHR